MVGVLVGKPIFQLAKTQQPTLILTRSSCHCLWRTDLVGNGCRHTPSRRTGTIDCRWVAPVASFKIIGGHYNGCFGIDWPIRVADPVDGVIRIHQSTGTAYNMAVFRKVQRAKTMQKAVGCSILIKVIIWFGINVSDIPKKQQSTVPSPLRFILCWWWSQQSTASCQWQLPSRRIFLDTIHVGLVTWSKY